MELQTQKGETVTSNREQLKVSTIFLAIVMIALSVSVALFICKPDLWQQVMMVKGDLLKGAVIGFTALPVLLFVTIKGGKTWFKKWWVWASISITVIGLILVATLSGGSSNSGMPNMGGPDMYGNPMGGKGNVIVRPMG